MNTLEGCGCLSGAELCSAIVSHSVPGESYVVTFIIT